MTTRKKVIIWFITLLVLPWLLTGGIVVFRCEYILPDYSKEKSSYTPSIFCEVNGKIETKGVRFLFLSINCDKPPYSLHFAYTTHNVVENATIIVERLSIEYDDGSSSDLKPFIGEKLTPKANEHFYVDDEGSQQRKLSLQAEVDIPDCIPVWKPFTLRVVCQLRAGETIVETCDLSRKYSRYVHEETMTTWSWMIQP